MPTKPDNKKIAACRELYLRYGGIEHRRIEEEMRALGWTDFNRRALYARGQQPGWPERFGWSVQSSSFSLSPASAKEQAKACTLNDDPFHAWLKTLPGDWSWDWRHMRSLYKKLQRVTNGDCKRLMICMPPRHGKSEVVTRYAAWRLLENPALRVIVASYNQALANLFSRKVRNAICDAVAWLRAGSAGALACMDAEASRRTSANPGAVVTEDGHTAKNGGVAANAMGRTSSTWAVGGA